MSKFAVGEKVDVAADAHELGTVVAVFPTIDGHFRYAVDTEGYGALQFFTEEKLVGHPCESVFKRNGDNEINAARADVPQPLVRSGPGAIRGLTFLS